MRFYVEHGEVIVDKSDERQVNALVSVVTGSPAQRADLIATQVLSSAIDSEIPARTTGEFISSCRADVPD